MVLLTISFGWVLPFTSTFLDWKSAENMVLSLTALCRQTVLEWKFFHRWFPAVQKYTLYLSGPKMSQQCISPFRLGLYWASQTAMVTVPLTPEGKLSCKASKSHVNRNSYYSQRSRILPCSTPSRQSGPKGYFGTMMNDGRTHQSQNNRSRWSASCGFWTCGFGWGLLSLWWSSSYG